MPRSALVAFLAVLSSVCLRADNIAYVTASGGGFGTEDLTTGAFTSLGTNVGTLAGLGVNSGSLFATDYHAASSNLYKVNPSNGALTTVGSMGIDVDTFGSTTTGLYAVSFGTYILYSINPSTGVATAIGPTGLTGGGWRNLSSNSGTLYYADGGNLYTLNTTTGAATLVGAFGGSAQEGALVFEAGILYGGDDVNNSVDTINTTTGAATVGPTSTLGAAFYGLAPDPIPSNSPSGAPEPASWALLGAGLAGLGVARRIRGRSLFR